MRQYIYKLLNGETKSKAVNKIFLISFFIIILLNVIAVVLETDVNIYQQYQNVFSNFEIFSVTIFTIEYLLRLWTCTADKRFKQILLGRVKFVLTPMALVDLFAFLPFYIPMIIPLDLRFIRAFRLFRIFRILKVGRYSESYSLIARVVKKKKEVLLITVFTVFVMLVIASTLMYYVENAAQPKAFSSILNSMWWGVATLTTVGYGDIFPVTPLGKFLGAIIALLGIGIFALPTSIMASGFTEELTNKKKAVCPHCKKEL